MKQAVLNFFWPSPPRGMAGPERRTIVAINGGLVVLLSFDIANIAGYIYVLQGTYELFEWWLAAYLAGTVSCVILNSLKFFTLSRNATWTLLSVMQITGIILFPPEAMTAFYGLFILPAVFFMYPPGSSGMVFFASFWFVITLVGLHYHSYFNPAILFNQADRELMLFQTTGLLTFSAMLLSLFLYRSFRRAEIALEVEKEKSESLLLNVLPKPIADRLKQSPGTIADGFDRVTVLFADLVGFTGLSQRLSPQELVNLLDSIFTEFDHLAEKHGLEKIKTIGDAYMIVGGVPTADANQHNAILDMALDMQQVMKEKFAGSNSPGGENELQLRIGIHSGPAVAGVIGKTKFSYDIWGDSVNTAARMESHGIPGKIQVTDDVYKNLKDSYRFSDRGEIEVKGKGTMRVWLLEGLA